MKERVLIIIERFGIGGVETHVVSIASALKNEKEFFIAAYDGDNKEYFVKEFKCICVLDKNGDFSANLESLIKFAKKTKINKIHVHQPGVYGEAHLLSKMIGVPYFVTTHGIVHPEKEWKEMIPVRSRYWREVLFPESSGMSTVSNQHIPFWEDACPIRKGKICLTRNCVDESTIKFKPSSGSTFFAAIRIDKEKERALKAAIDFVAHLRSSGKMSAATLDIAGSGEMYEEYVRKYNKEKWIKFLGSIEQIPSIISDYDYVIGTGRAALEGVAAGKLVFIFGPWGEHGILTPKNFIEFSKSNFNGRFSKNISIEEMAESLIGISVAERSNIVKGNYKHLTGDYGNSTVKKEINYLYSKSDSIDISATKLLELIVCSDKYVIEEKRYMADIISARNEIDYLKMQCDEQKKQIIDKDRLILSVLNSRSWKLTSPIRKIVSKMGDRSEK